MTHSPLKDETRDPCCVGVLMLDTRFERWPGDIGHPRSFTDRGLAVRYRVVGGASPGRIVNPNDPGLLPAFVDAGRQLVAEGVSLVSTSCGFLVRYQRALADALPVPVFTSSLLLCRSLERAAILTIDAGSLTGEPLAAAGVAPDTPVVGLPKDSHFRQCILADDGPRDFAVCDRELADLARSACRQYPQVSNLVLECTNMPPHEQAIVAACGLPVHHLLDEFARRLAPRQP
ncbi:MAG: aspartate/glutamate racemase family protein [Burkholderiaceae bacterium]